MSIYGYYILEKVLEQGSYVKAAEHLHLTPSAISHIIAKLEDEVGLKILNRDRNGVSLTGSGRTLMPYARELLRAEENLNQVVAQIHGVEKGVVRIGSFNSAIVQWLPPIIRDFHAEYPGVEIEVIHGSYDEMLEWLNSSTIDIAFLSAIAEPAAHLKSAEILDLYDDPIVCVTPPGFKPAHKGYVTIDDIRDEPLIMQTDDFDQEAKHFLDKHGLASKSSFAIKGDDGIIAMVSAGFGIYIMPELVIKGIPGDYKAFPFRPAEYRHVQLCVNKLENPAPAVELMRDHIMRYVKSIR